MNIGQSLYSTPKNKNELKSAIMSGHKRVIVVNIQKFKFLKKLLESENVSKLLKDERVAFIIDEIHRSNSGTMHNTMTDMFSDLTDDFLRFSENLKTNKKNLIIALTATPTEENLARFGEMDYIGGQPLWRPLDSYTMNSAIKDGFVLDPTKSLLFISQSYYFEEKEGVRLPNKKEIYSNVDRIKECSKIIVKTLIETTYNQIAKQAKAMLCCYSIEIANEYFDEIKKQLKEYLKIKNYSNKEIEEIQNMILMVYTDSQSSGLPAYKRCGMKNEKDVINKFKDGKNGLMIVVDKLQTGFNEPKLHTLILDKEVSGINCVQTLSRVNRVMKGKKDCLVVDFSYNNENAKNIRDAFKKYESVACSSIDPFSIQEKIEDDYKKIIKSEYYNLYFKDYEKNISRAMQKSEYINLKLNNENKENEIKNLHFAMSCFRKNVILIKEIILLREDIVSEDLMRFINEFMNIVYLLVKDKYDDSGFTDIVIEENGFIVNEEISTFDGGNNNVKEDKKNNKSTGLSSLDEIIERNKIEESKRENIEKYKKILHSFFEIIELKDEEKINGMFRKTLFVDEKISDEDYVRIYNLAKRDFRRKDEDCSKFIDMIDEVKEFIKNDYVYYLKNKK
jgi:type I restriction enzyme R subunit